MTALLEHRPDLPAEFPTLDLDELDNLAEQPLTPAVYLGTFERDELPGILAAALPEVARTSRQELNRFTHEYQFIDTRTAAACRLVLTYDGQAHQVLAQVAELGDGLLFQRLMIACAEWERDGRPDPATWTP